MGTKTEEGQEVFHSMSEFRRKMFPASEKEQKQRELQQQPESLGAQLADELVRLASERLRQE